MRRISKRLHIACLLCVCASLHFSNAQVNGEEELGAWYMYFGTSRISERLSIHSEAQFRYYETTGNFNQLLLRTGLNYHINPEAIATLGYGYISTDGSFDEPVGSLDSREHRIFQQFIVKNKLSVVDLEHRYRLEQRFISLGGNSNTEHRARYRLQIQFPIAGDFFASLYDEIFLNLQGEVFGQNRAYAALGYRVSPNLSVQLGYLKNHFPAAHYDRLQVGVFLNTDFRKKPAVP